MNGLPRYLTALVVTSVVLAAGGAVLAPPASAADHVTSVSASCVDGQARLVIDLAGFPSGLDNRVTATDNATGLVDQTFRGDYRRVWNLPGSARHTFSYFVTSADDLDQSRGYTTHQEKYVEPCPAAAPRAEAAPAAPPPPAGGRPPAAGAPAAARTPSPPADPAPPPAAAPARPAATPAQRAAPVPDPASTPPIGTSPAHPAPAVPGRPGPSIGTPTEPGKIAAPRAGLAPGGLPPGAGTAVPTGAPSPTAAPESYPDPYGDRTLPGPRSLKSSLLADGTPAEVGVDASVIVILAAIAAALLLAWLTPRLLRRVAATPWWQERGLRPSRTALRS